TQTATGAGTTSPARSRRRDFSMPGQWTPDPAHVAALVAAAVTPETDDRTTLMTLNSRCWPGGQDRTVPAGRQWIRAWGSRPMTAVPHQCGPAAPRCGYCN